MMKRQVRAYCYATLAVLCWSTVASAFKISLRFTSSEMLLLISSFGAFVVLASLVVVTGQWRSWREWRGRDLGLSALLGLLNPFVYYLVLFQAYDLLPAQEAQPLNFIWPFVLVAFSVLFLKQRVHFLSIAAMLVSFFGVLVISTRGNLIGLQITDKLGVALALGSSIVWALYWTLTINDRIEPLARLCVNFFFGVIFTAIYLCYFGKFTMPSVNGWIGGIYIGLFEMGLTFYFWLKALQLSKTTAQVSSLIFITPFFSLLLIHVLVGEPVYASTLPGLLLIIGGILIHQFVDRKMNSAV
ncbi:DMT family transporter [Pseudomonadota bacterium]